MRDDPLPGPVEMLDGWDDDSPEASRRSRSWMIGAVALFAVGAIVVVVVVGGTHPSAIDQVTPSESSSAPETSRREASTSPTAVTTQTPTGSANRAAVQLPALSSDDPAEPLRISLLDPAALAPSAGLIAYRVQICVSDESAGVASDKVRVTAGNWQLAAFPGTVDPSAGVPGVAPQFPFETRLGKGQCASGYVTFAWNVVEIPNALIYNDKRFGWYWRLT